MTDYGVDLSHHNEVTDWQAVKTNGVGFGWAKASHGTSVLDPAFDSHIDGFRSIGVRNSGYHYVVPGNLEAQVKTFVARLNRKGLLKPGNLAPMLDVEDPTIRPNGNAVTAECIRRYREISGQRRIVVYANLDWFTHVLRPDEWADQDVTLWIARYGAPIGHPGFAHPRLGIHQYTNVGRIRGISGNVDCDATMPGWTADQFTIPGGSSPTPTANGGTKLMERIHVIPPDGNTHSIRINTLPGTPQAAVIIRRIHADGTTWPMYIGHIVAWGSDIKYVGNDPKDRKQSDRVDGDRKYDLPGALWCDLEYSANEEFWIDVVG